MSEPLYPDVTVQLTGEDGNGFFIVGRVGMALRQAGVDAETVDQYRNEALSGTYQDLLAVTQAWVNVE